MAGKALLLEFLTNGDGGVGGWAQHVPSAIGVWGRESIPFGTGGGSGSKHLLFSLHFSSGDYATSDAVFFPPFLLPPPLFSKVAVKHSPVGGLILSDCDCRRGGCRQLFPSIAADSKKKPCGTRGITGSGWEVSGWCGSSPEPPNQGILSFLGGIG